MTGARQAGLLMRAAVSGAADLDEAIGRAAGTAPMIRPDPDFEAAAGITSHDDKVLHAWKRFATGEVGAVPRALASVV